MKHFLNRPSIKWLLAIFLTLLLAFIGTQTASAHGYVVRSTPTDRSVLARSPNQVQIWFSEGLESRFSTIQVFDQTGQQVDLGDGGVDERNTAKLVVSLPSELPPGAYLVKMRPVFTSDGHAVSDTLVFWVGEQTGSIDAQQAADTAVPLEAVWRIILNLALTVYFGTMLMYIAVLRPAWGSQRWPLGHLPPRVMGRLRLLLWASLIIATAANLIALLQISMTLFEADIANVVRDNLWDIVLAGTNFGDVWKFRAVLLMAMLFIQIIAAQQARNRPTSTHILWLVNGILAALTLGTISLISHAAGSPLWPVGSVLADYVHLMAVAAWVGGLIVLTVILRPALGPLGPQERGQALHVLIRRFSFIATIALGLVIVTGLYATFANVFRPRDITGTTYGLTLLAKWILILPVFVLGAIHFVTASPQRMERAAQWINTRLRFVQLPNTLRLEMLLMLAVMFITGFLPATPPPVPQTSRGEVEVATQTLTVEGYDITLAVNPGVIGSNSYDVNIEQSGQPADIDAVTIRFSYPPLGVYTPSLALDETEADLWVGADGSLNRAVQWDALIDLNPPDGPPIRAALRWNVVEEVQDKSSRSAGLLNWLSAAAILIVLAAWAGPLVYQGVTALQWTPESAAATLIAVGMTIGIAVSGAVMFSHTGQRIEQERNQPPEQINPIFADQESLVQGRQIYEAQCLTCHGEDGHSHRPFALNLSRPTPNLAEALQERDDEDVLRILQQGIVSRHLVGSDLSEREQWHLINFLRSF